MDPESEDSDVSAAEDSFASFTMPVGLPPAPSKQSLENQETIQGRLDELERFENHNIGKHSRLKSKRLRMDERIARKRAQQDVIIKAITLARERRDSRINLRRERENIAFQRVYEDFEEEDNVIDFLLAILHN